MVGKHPALVLWVEGVCRCRQNQTCRTFKGFKLLAYESVTGALNRGVPNSALAQELAEKCSTNTLRETSRLSDHEVPVLQVQPLQIEESLLRHTGEMLVSLVWHELETCMQGVGLTTA